MDMPQTPYIREFDGSIREGRVVHPGKDWSLAIEATAITCIRVDHQSRLQFGDTEVMIETSFRLHTGDTEHVLEPSERAGLGPLLALFPDIGPRLRRTSRKPAAGLRQWIMDQYPPDSDYEAWQVAGPGSRLVVCAPGGRTLAVWP